VFYRPIGQTDTRLTDDFLEKFDEIATQLSDGGERKIS
jgi:hypothetical protein